MVPLDKNQITAVLEFLDYFRNPREDFFTVAAGAGVLDPYVYSPMVQKFVDALYKNNFIRSFDWRQYQNVAKKYMEDGNIVEKADLETLLKLFTIHVRKERFQSGHLATVIENGHILRLLGRLEVLAAEM